jgi:hypothetical protein
MSKIAKVQPYPSSHASEQSIGTIKTGNDSKKWIILPNTSGIKKWICLTNPIKKYKVHWNGERPYMVIIAKNTIIILKSHIDDNGKTFFNELILKLDKYKSVFVGSNTPKFGSNYSEKFTGNSILIEIKPNEYIFVGENVYKFTTTTPITKYYSIMGNSDIPYPFAISNSKIYLMIVNETINYIDWYDKKTDPYNIYYNFEKKYSKIKSAKYSVKYIDKRKK